MLPLFRQPTERGFTLIEVLVALAVIGIGLLAVLAVAAKSVEVAADLQDRTFAGWVAQNRITEMRLSQQWPSIGESDDDVTLGGRKWHWHATVASTPDKDLRRVTVTVAPADATSTSVTEMVGFVGKPTSQPGGVPSPASAGAAAGSQGKAGGSKAQGGGGGSKTQGGGGG